MLSRDAVIVPDSGTMTTVVLIPAGLTAPKVLQSFIDKVCKRFVWKGKREKKNN